MKIELSIYNIFHKKFNHFCGLAGVLGILSLETKATSAG
jgi:hypothetical protein